MSVDLDFAKGNGLVPAIIQDVEDRSVLMLGFMNEDALNETRQSGKVTFYSRSKKRLWTKGETSGNYLLVEEIIPDCDNDTVLIKARPLGPVCHTGEDTCFGSRQGMDVSFLNKLQSIIKDRKSHPREGSYTSGLFQSGVNKIAQKVGEEAVELVIEAKDTNDELFKNEAADLLFHLMILLLEKGYDLQDIVAILEERHNK